MPYEDLDDGDDSNVLAWAATAMAALFLVFRFFFGGAPK